MSKALDDWLAKRSAFYKGPERRDPAAASALRVAFQALSPSDQAAAIAAPDHPVAAPAAAAPSDAASEESDPDSDDRETVEVSLADIARAVRDVAEDADDGDCKTPVTAEEASPPPAKKSEPKRKVANKKRS
jgi:hypothetical protein